VRIVLPYTHIAPGVREAIEATGWDWDEVDVSGSDDAYWDTLSVLWASQETFVIVEHDVLVRPDTFDELQECLSPWCAFLLPYLGGEYPGMGCVKFTDQIIAACPDALVRVGKMSNSNHPPKHWCTTDHWLQMVVLPTTGYQKHVHSPALGHWRPYDDGLPQPSHGCCGTRVKETE
jgi:hypothetical protein